MTGIKKFAWSGTIVALAAIAAMAMLWSTAFAAHTLSAPATAVAGSTIELTVTGLDPLAVPLETVVFERLGTSTATGFFVANNAQTLQCLDGDATCDLDAATPGTIRVEFFISAGSPAGDLNISASTLGVGGHSVTESIAVSGGVGALAAINVTGPTTIADNGEAQVTIFATDAAGNRIVVNDVDVVATRATLAQTVGNDCQTLAADDGLNNDANCVLAATTVSATNPARVGVYENGNIGQTIQVTAFVIVGGVPISGQHTMTIVGAAASAELDVPATLDVAESANVVVTVKDATGNDAPPTPVNVSASEGTVVCPATMTANGSFTCTFVAPGVPGPVVVTAVVTTPPGVANIILSETIQVGDVTAPPPPPGEGQFSPVPTAAGLTITSYTGSLAAFMADGAALGLTSCFATVGGQFVGHVFGAPAFVNANFNAQFAAGLDNEGLICRL